MATANSKITPLAFYPKPGFTAAVHVLDMPDELRRGLFSLLGDRGAYGQLPRSLHDCLCLWRNDVHVAQAIRRSSGKEWLVSLRPFSDEDYLDLVNAVLIWARTECGADGGSSECGALGELVNRQAIGEAVATEKTLVDFHGTPCDPFAFNILPMIAAQRLSAQPLALASGEVLRFRHVLDGGNRGWTLISQTMDCKGDLWAWGITFHLETLPPARKAWLLASLEVKRFAGAFKGESGYFPNDVRVLVSADGSPFSVIPISYDGKARGMAWDCRALAQFEAFSGRRLPEPSAYMADAGLWAQGKGGLEILAPYSLSSGLWARRHRVELGFSMRDKAMAFDALRDALAGAFAPCCAMSHEANLIHLKTLGWGNPTCADSAEKRSLAVQQRLCRQRLRAAVQREKVVFELIGMPQDARLLDLAESYLEQWFGPSDNREVLEVSVVRRIDEALGRPLSFGDAGAEQVRMREISARYEAASADEVVACLVVMPGKDEFGRVWVSDTSLGGGGRIVDRPDPKQAVRLGLASSGRLSQFLVPAQEGEDWQGAVEHRVKSAVGDLLRQLGFSSVLEQGFCEARPTVLLGLTAYQVSNRPRMSIPILVTMDVVRGRTLLDCPLWAGESLPYWQGLLRLAELSCGGDFAERCKRLDGNSLKRLLDHALDQAHQNACLLVDGCSAVRNRDWWPGISDAGIADSGGDLRYGLNDGQAGFFARHSSAKVVRVRAASREIPDYFTDPKDEQDALSGHHARQGIFRQGDVFYALAPRPNEGEYIASASKSKDAEPHRLFREKTLVEYYVFGSDESGEKLEIVRFANAFRERMVQFDVGNRLANLPLPLHVAHKTVEYVWKRNPQFKAAKGARARAH